MNFRYACSKVLSHNLEILPGGTLEEREISICAILTQQAAVKRADIAR